MSIFKRLKQGRRLWKGAKAKAGRAHATMRDSSLHHRLSDHAKSGLGSLSSGAKRRIRDRLEAQRKEG